MRVVSLVCFGLLISCGSKDDSDPAPAAAVVPPDVSALFVDGQPSCYTESCSISIGGSCAADCLLSGDYKFVVTMTEGSPASACSSVSIAATYKAVLFQGLKNATKYSFRGCLLNEKTGTYSAGTTLTYQMP